MIADGPSANRPPHIALEPCPLLLSRSLKTFVLGCVLISGGCDRQSGEPVQPKADAGGETKKISGELDRSMAGEALPAMTLQDAAGRSLDTASLKGTPLLVNLWATWCAPCVIELPMLNQISSDMEGELKVLTVSQDIAQTEKVAPFLAERGLERLEPWLDPKSDLTYALGAQTLPTTILYDADGKEVWRYIGGNDWTSAESRELIVETN